jgi:hypothetical protein
MNQPPQEYREQMADREAGHGNRSVSNEGDVWYVAIQPGLQQYRTDRHRKDEYGLARLGFRVVSLSVFIQAQEKIRAPIKK